MRGFNLIVILVLAATVVWAFSVQRSAAQAQAEARAAYMRIVGLGMQMPLPSEADGMPYLPVHSTDRQMTFTAEQWANSNNEIAPLLWNSTIMPKQVTICGHRLTMIQGTLRTSANDDSYYFPVTVNATGLAVPNDGCFSVTPVAYLRIKGITTIPRAQLPNVTVTATY